MPTILVLDDLEPVRVLTRRYLEAAGYTVVGAQSAPAALQLLQKVCPDLAIVDLRMPEMNGAEFALRAAELRPGLRILFMSAYPPPVLETEGLLARHHFHFLPKPYTHEALLGAVRDLLAAACTSYELPKPGCATT
jgi:two-component system, cell cycle sensor histidine kinase and response regulator CckA